MCRLAALALCLLTCISSGPAAAQPLPQGSTTIVNSVLTHAALNARIGANDGDSFRIVWQQFYEATGYDVRSRRLQANAAFGGESSLNLFLTGNQANPDVAMNGSGDWAAVWQDDSQVGGGTENHVYSRRTSSDGALLSAEIAIDDPSTTISAGPVAVDIDATDEMAVSWRDTDRSIWFERLSDSGVGFGEFTVGIHAEFNSPHSVAALGPNRSVVAWTDADASGVGVFVRCVTDSGPLGPATPVNLVTAGTQRMPVLAAADDGHFAVIWHSSSTPSLLEVRLFDRNCVPTGGEIDVDDSPATPEVNARIGMAPDGAFVVTWDIAGAANDIYAREFTKSGRPVGGAFSVPGAAFGTPRFPDVAVGPRTFAVVWSSPDYGLDASNDVLVRRFLRRVVFTDDFESEDATAWSAVVP